MSSQWHLHNACNVQQSKFKNYSKYFELFKGKATNPHNWKSETMKYLAFLYEKLPQRLSKLPLAARLVFIFG